MTTSSMAIQNVINAYQRNLNVNNRSGGSEGKEDRRNTDEATIVSHLKHANLRQRFGAHAVRDYKKASMETYRQIQGFTKLQ